MMPGENAEQLKYWNGVAGAKWTANQETMDGVLSPISAEVLARADARRGERVLDVGCGCGDTTMALGALVAPDGQVTGIDISAPMLARARERAAQAALPIAFEHGDAATHKLADKSMDLLFSRFGVMFFENPTRAFANLHTALKPAGRLVFVCWRGMAENGWIMTPMAGALAVLSEHRVPPPPPPPPGAPGPFAFADPKHVERILVEAGYRNVVLSPFDTVLKLGRSVEEALAFVLELGPVSRLIAELPDDLRDAVKMGVHDALARAASADGLRFGAATWMVSAAAHS